MQYVSRKSLTNFKDSLRRGYAPKAEPNRNEKGSADVINDMFHSINIDESNNSFVSKANKVDQSSTNISE